MAKKYSVLTVGNALLDIIAHVDEKVLDDIGIKKGSMNLVDEEFSKRLVSKLQKYETTPGGSAANTAAGIASFGGRSAYIGRVRDDEHGTAFISGLEADGLKSGVVIANDGPSTGKSIVLMTPDAERTFCTYLGAAETLSPEDVDTGIVSDSEIAYLEGYIWDSEKSKAAIMKVIKTAHKAGSRAALTLSDSFCVDRHRSDFRNLAEKNVDILFCNEHEIISLFQVMDIDGAVEKAKELDKLVVITVGPKGTIVVDRSKVMRVDAVQVPKVIDRNGAGDMYAAGFLFGLTAGKSLEECAHLGSVASAEIIQHYGARPERKLSSFLNRS